MSKASTVFTAAGIAALAAGETIAIRTVSSDPDLTTTDWLITVLALGPAIALGPCIVILTLGALIATAVYRR